MVTHLLADLDAGAAPAREENTVASLDRSGDDLAVLAGGTGADSDNGGLGERSRSGRRREEDARSGFLNVSWHDRQRAWSGSTTPQADQAPKPPTSSSVLQEAVEMCGETLRTVLTCSDACLSQQSESARRRREPQ